MAFDDRAGIVTEVKSIPKNNRGDYIRISKVEDKDTSEFKGIDIRQYYTGDDDELYPTKKGIRINAKFLKEVMEILNNIASEVNIDEE